MLLAPQIAPFDQTNYMYIACPTWTLALLVSQRALKFAVSEFVQAACEMRYRRAAPYHIPACRNRTHQSRRCQSRFCPGRLYPGRTCFCRAC